MNENKTTNDYIFESFFKLLETKPYEKISVSEIADNAYVSRMSFYRSFKSKKDLVSQALNKIVCKLKNEILNMPERNEYTVLKSIFETIKDYKSLLISLLNSSISKEVADTIVNKMRENSPDDFFNKTIKYVPVFYFTGMTSVMIEWLKTGCNESPEEMARFLCSLTAFDIYEKFSENHNKDN